MHERWCNTSLHGSQNGHSDVVCHLLNANAHHNLHWDDGASPRMASICGHFAVVVILLLNASANPNHQNDKGMTPLMAACLYRHPSIVGQLLINGANPYLRDSSNSTALMHVCPTKWLLEVY